MRSRRSVHCVERPERIVNPIGAWRGCTRRANVGGDQLPGTDPLQRRDPFACESTVEVEGNRFPLSPVNPGPFGTIRDAHASCHLVAITRKSAFHGTLRRRFRFGVFTLPKLDVAGSAPVARSLSKLWRRRSFSYGAALASGASPEHREQLVASGLGRLIARRDSQPRRKRASSTLPLRSRSRAEADDMADHRPRLSQGAGSFSNQRLR